MIKAKSIVKYLAGLLLLGRILGEERRRARIHHDWSHHETQHRFFDTAASSLSSLARLQTVRRQMVDNVIVEKKCARNVREKSKTKCDLLLWSLS